jgi:prevent-host-death family protein
MVTKARIMTMSSRTWSVAAAKAELSRVLRRARREPQVIESRGEPIAVVVGVDDYRRLSEHESSTRRWRAFLELSKTLGVGGGADLDIPPRRPRASPFGSRRRPTWSRRRGA